MELISPAEFAKNKIESVQEYTFLSARALGNLFKRPIYTADMIQQADFIGFGSMSIVLSSCFFIGVALALNSATTLARFGAQTLIGELVAIGVVRELGPLLAGLVVAGRNASGIASELGSMIVTEQIDAMRALGTDPIQKLVTPRMLAMAIMLPLLTILADFVGMCGGYVIARLRLNLEGAQYWTTATQSLQWDDITQGLLKPFVFSF